MAFTFRSSDAAIKVIRKIKEDTGIATSSKALEYVLDQFLVMQKEMKDLSAALYEAQFELRNIKMTVANKTESDMAYNKMISSLVSK